MFLIYLITKLVKKNSRAYKLTICFAYNVIISVYLANFGLINISKLTRLNTSNNKVHAIFPILFRHTQLKLLQTIH